MSRRSFDDPHGKSDAARQALLDNRNEARYETAPNTEAGEGAECSQERACRVPTRGERRQAIK